SARSSARREGAAGSLDPDRYRVSPGYHEALGIPLLRGRLLSVADGPGAPVVIVISNELARRYWPDASPIGATVHLGSDTATVVGVVGDVRSGSLTAEPRLAFYASLYQAPSRAVSFVVRAPGGASGVVG
ncbi:MAG TPA: permease, partial [Gemmatimonadetes bacterium]|nr:permease [Gemmatimonadota bacterium]